MRGRYLWQKAGKAPKKWRKTGKNSLENWKRKVYRKMTFLCHGKPENFKISADILILKTAETGKLFWKPKRQWKVAETRKTGKKAMERWKNMKFSMESRKRIPYNPPPPDIASSEQRCGIILFHTFIHLYTYLVSAFVSQILNYWISWNIWNNYIDC